MFKSLYLNRLSNKVLLYLVLSVLAFIFMFPLVFMFASSFKGNEAIFSEIFSWRAFVPTQGLVLDNFSAVLERSNIGKYYYNSLVITFSTLVFGLFVNSLAAYSLSRMTWTGQKVILSVIIMLMVIPFESIVISLLMMVSELPWISVSWDGVTIEKSWLNTLRVQIFPFVAHPFSIFLFYQFFREIPKDFDAAATLDGASPFQIYRHVIVPLSGPVFATVAILQFLFMWNQYLWPIIAVQGEEFLPVMPGIQQFFGRTVSWGEVMAYATMITVPVLIFFVIFQRLIVKSVAESGVK